MNRAQVAQFDLRTVDVHPSFFLMKIQWKSFNAKTLNMKNRLTRINNANNAVHTEY